MKNRLEFPLGMYEQPRTEEEWEEWSRAGINILRCRNRAQLDEAGKRGMMGWVPIRMIVQNEEEANALAQRVESLKDHPSLVVWEAPDEAIWNACRLDDGTITTRAWSQPESIRAMLHGRLDSVVGGLQRGTSIVRALDPSGKIWLNEACESDQDTLARCAPFLDVVGFDYYPITQMGSDGNTMCHIGRYGERFRETAPSKDVWVVQQAFSWSSIRPEDGRARAHPTLEECRFMAWNAIVHGATGLLWWGSHREERPLPFLHDLMAVVSELNDVKDFLVAGNVTRVSIRADPRQHPTISGVSGIVRRAGKKTMLVIMDEDLHDHDAIVAGVDWVDVAEMEPMTPVSSDFTEIRGGWITRMKRHEARVYVGS